MASEIDRYSCDVCCRRELPEPDYECEQKTGEDTADGYAPFVDPGGDDADDLPTIYETRESEVEYDYESDGLVHYVSDDFSPRTEQLTSWSASGDEWTYAQSGTATLPAATEPPYYCDSASDSGSGFPAITFSPETYPDDLITCTATTREEVIDYGEYTGGGGITALKGCPGVGVAVGEAWFGFHNDWSGSASETVKDVDTLSDPTTHAETITAAEDERDEADWESGGCEASTTSTWPALADFRDWPDCDDMADGLEATATAAASKLRMRWSLPTGWPGSYFRVDWDWVFFPADEEEEPSILDSETWEYDGENSPSDWFEIAPPAGELGTVEPRNVRFIGWSTTDSIPQYHADFETYDP